MRKLTRDEVRACIIAIVSQCGEIPASTLKPHECLFRYGLDSVAGVNIAYEIGVLMGRDVPASLVTEHDSIEKLVDYVVF
jgi:acyl carrier protein